MANDLETAFNEIAEARALPREVVIEALQSALVSAYRRDANASSAQRVEARIDPNTGRARIFVEKEVVDAIFNDSTEVTLETARFYEPEAQLGDMVMVQVEGSTKRFGRIAAQTAKQVILQKIREAERNALYDEFADRAGDLITGTVQSVNASMVTLSLGRAEAIMPRNQQIPGERYRPHEKLRTYCLEVKRTNRGPQIIVSRSHRNMLRRLLEYEVPEIFNGQIEIKSIAREAGYRSKVAVAALQDGIDPVGACVGMRGVRIQNIVKELHDEKIDVIEWKPNHEQFISEALKPARVTGVYLEDDPDSGRTAVVIVPDDQLSLAIGREGQNARLAAKLTGWRIDIKSVPEAVNWALSNLHQPMLAEIREQYADMVADVERVIEKRAQNRAVTAEELNLLGKFADLVERRLLAERERSRQRRREEINAVKATLPANAFTISVEDLDLSDEIIEALKPLGNAGEVMLRFLIDEDRIRRLLADVGADALTQVQTALDKAVFPDFEELGELDEDEEEALPEADVLSPEAEEVPLATDEPAMTPEPSLEEAIDEPLWDAFGNEALVPTVAASEARPKAEKREAVVDFDEYDYDDDEEDEEIISRSKKHKKKGQKKGRQLVFDEKTGKMIAKRQRKGNRRGGVDWDDF